MIDRVDYLIDSPPGSDIGSISELYLQLKSVPGSRVSGFVFNGYIVRNTFGPQTVEGCFQAYCNEINK